MIEAGVFARGHGGDVRLGPTAPRRTVSKPGTTREPPKPFTAQQKRDLRTSLIIIGVAVAGFAVLIVGALFWDHAAFPRELAESTPHSVLQEERSDPATWSYVDDDLVTRPWGECVRIDGWRLQRPWQCTSADGSHVLTFLYSTGRHGSGLHDQTLTVRGEDVPIECTRGGAWHAAYYCVPESVLPADAE
jgi:hypothetical protein